MKFLAKTLAILAALIGICGAASAATYRWENIDPYIFPDGTPLLFSGIVVINNSYLPTVSGAAGLGNANPPYWAPYFGLDYFLWDVGEIRAQAFVCTPENSLYYGCAPGQSAFRLFELAGPASFSLDFTAAGNFLAGRFYADNGSSQARASGSDVWTVEGTAFGNSSVCNCPNCCSGGTGRWVFVPEPGTLALLGLGLTGLGLSRRRKAQ